MKILVLNGPNINFLGIRETNVYGRENYQDLINYLNALADSYNIQIEIKQSNCEGTLIDYLQQGFFEHVDGIVFNPGAFTHYSYAIRDAISSISIPTVEVHLSDINNREEFRKISVIADVCETRFFGRHFNSYGDAIIYLVNKNMN